MAQRRRLSRLRLPRTPTLRRHNATPREFGSLISDTGPPSRVTLPIIESHRGEGANSSSAVTHHPDCEEKRDAFTFFPDQKSVISDSYSTHYSLLCPPRHRDESRSTKLLIDLTARPSNSNCQKYTKATHPFDESPPCLTARIDQSESFVNDCNSSIVILPTS